MLLLLLLACHPDKPGDTTVDTGDTAAHTGDTSPDSGDTGALTWTDCGEGTQCAEVEVPLADTTDERISLHVRRLLPTAPVTRVLWYVDGGPGDAGTRLVPVLSFFGELFPDMAVYAMDARGSGASTPLSCPAEEDAASDEGAVISEAEWPACVASLDAERLAAFSTIAAADDLGSVVPRAVEGLPVVLFGASYGTFLVQRTLERHPDLAVGAVLDGLVPPDWSFAEFDPSMDATGRRYLALCDADADCAAHLPEGAAAAATRILGELAAEPCGAYGPDEARALLGALLLQGDHRAAMPALLTRLDRCEEADRAALDHLVTSFGDESWQSQVSLANVASGDLYPSEVDVEGAEAFLDTAVVGTGAGAWVARRAAQWPRWEPPPPSVQSTEIPVLLLHGGLDPTVPLERLDGLFAAFPGARVVTPPGAGHVTINFSDCAANNYLLFLTDPDISFDDCDDEAFQEDFSLSAAESEALFGDVVPW